MRTYKTEGFVIKRRNFREADRLLTVFTKRNGKIQINAPGVRKITSRRASHVELLNYSLFSIYESRNLPILTEAQSIETFPSLKNNLSKVSALYYVCELIDGLCPENQENEKVFHLLKDFLFDLKTKQDQEELIRKFEINLLTILGFYRTVEKSQNINMSLFIERILERKLKTKQINLC